MTIGIDIDDTITNSSVVIAEYIKTYSNNQHLIDNIEGVVRGDYHEDDLKEFYAVHGRAICDAIEVKPGASEVIRKLHEEGNKIIIVSARNDVFCKNCYEVTCEYLRRRGIYYDKFINDLTYKIERCKEEGIDILIDDGVDTVEDANNNDIKAYLFTSPINKNKLVNVERLDSWPETYLRIKQYQSNHEN